MTGTAVPMSFSVGGLPIQHSSRGDSCYIQLAIFDLR